MPGSMRWTSAPSETKSSAPSGRMFRPYLITTLLLICARGYVAEARPSGRASHVAALTPSLTVGLPLRGSILLHSAEGREAAVHGHDYACDEAGGRRQEPQHSAEQVFRLAEAAHRRVTDDALAARGETARLLVGQEEAVLLGQEEAGGDGVDAYARRVLGRQVHGEPLREAVDAGLRGGVREDARQGADGAHRGDVQNHALATLGHQPAEDLAGE